jgi:hypothetical protein
MAAKSGAAAGSIEILFSPDRESGFILFDIAKPPELFLS